MDQFSDMAQPSILTTTYLEEFLGCFLLLEGDEAKVLALLLHFIVRLLDAGDGPVLLEEFSNLLVGQLGLEFADVDLPLLGVGFFDGNLLALYNVVACSDGVPERGNFLVDDETEPSAPARVLICVGRLSFTDISLDISSSANN